MKKCTKCGGTGIVNIGYLLFGRDYDTCEHCNGTGKEPESKNERDAKCLKFLSATPISKKEDTK